MIFNSWIIYMSIFVQEKTLKAISVHYYICNEYIKKN